MTEVNLNETVNGYRGSIGRLVFKKYKGRTIVSRKPVVTKEPTAGQTAHRARFKEATSFAESAMADPMLRAFYEPIAKEREITVYTLAVADYLREPEFKYVDVSKYQGKVGDTIVIQAEDDLGMAEVNVKITSNTGALIESGSAVEIGARQVSGFMSLQQRLLGALISLSKPQAPITLVMKRRSPKTPLWVKTHNIG